MARWAGAGSGGCALLLLLLLLLLAPAVEKGDVDGAVVAVVGCGGGCGADDCAAGCSVPEECRTWTATETAALGVPRPMLLHVLGVMTTIPGVWECSAPAPPPPAVVNRVAGAAEASVDVDAAALAEIVVTVVGLGLCTCNPDDEGGANDTGTALARSLAFFELGVVALLGVRCSREGDTKGDFNTAVEEFTEPLPVAAAAEALCFFATPAPPPVPSPVVTTITPLDEATTVTLFRLPALPALGVVTVVPATATPLPASFTPRLARIGEGINGSVCGSDDEDDGEFAVRAAV